MNEQIVKVWAQSCSMWGIAYFYNNLKQNAIMVQVFQLFRLNFCNFICESVK